MKLLCAGAAKGLIEAWREDFMASTGIAIDARFGAVGAMKDALLAGEPCDAMVVTDTLIAALQREGRLLAGSESALGCVRTGIAVRAGDAVPDIGDADALRRTLLAASAVYFPDAQKSTAGIHFAKVLGQLGIAVAVASRLHTFPNGAAAMRELAADTGTRPIGCTQVTEIRYTEGVTLVGLLPEGFELVTTYTAAVCTAAADPAQAALLVALLSGPDSKAIRVEGGFDP